MVITLISELGQNGIKKFPNSKAFTSYIGVAPNNSISGGKKLRKKNRFLTKKRLKTAFLHCKNTIGNSKKGFLKDIHSKMRFRIGRSGANKVVARKLAVIIYHMLTKKENYKPNDPLEEKQKKKEKTIKLILKKAKEYDINLEKLSCIKI